MRKVCLLLTGLAIGMSTQAQTFSDDFESYTVGDYLAATSSDWETWSGTTGGADDVQVVDDNANGGSQSIYFEATGSNGGPDDIVLPFGGQYATGEFDYSMMMYIESGTGAYFNFQALSTVGQTWALECAITESGAYTLSNTDGTYLTGTMSTGQWVEVEFSIDLDQNEWEFFLDGTSEGTFSNTVNQVASIDLFPVNNGGNGQSSFWVDDVSFTYTSSTLPGLNGAVTGLDPINGLTGQTKRPTITVRNLGNANITSFDIELDYDGEQQTQSVSGVNLASYDSYDVEFTDGIELVSGTNVLTATISNVNGSTSDDDASDDSKSLAVTPIEAGLNKMVLVEEATGTWCGWCPRGTVWMAYMQENYPDHFVGVAVHNGDPMVDDDYDEDLGNIISGYPSAIVDRGGDIDPSGIEVDFLQRVVMDATASFCMGATHDEENNELTVNMEVTLMDAVDSDWKVAIALTEDGVSGTSSDWAQANYYSGGGSGDLIGAGKEWHNEPNPVPASEMVYDHVARVIAPSFAGMDNSFPEGGVADDEFDFEFTVALNPDWDMDHLHLIGMLIDANGRVDNATVSELTEAIGHDCDAFPAGLEAVSYETPALSVYPNPASSGVNIKMVLMDAQPTVLTVRDVMGRTVYQTQISDRSGLYELYLDLSKVNAGMYLVETRSGETFSTTRFLKN